MAGNAANPDRATQALAESEGDPSSAEVIKTETPHHKHTCVKKPGCRRIGQAAEAQRPVLLECEPLLTASAIGTGQAQSHGVDLIHLFTWFHAKLGIPVYAPTKFPLLNSGH